MPFLVKFHETHNCKIRFPPPLGLCLWDALCVTCVFLFLKNKSLLRNSIFLNRGAITCIFLFQSRTIRQLGSVCHLNTKYGLRKQICFSLGIIHKQNVATLPQKLLFPSQALNNITNILHPASILSSWPMEFFFKKFLATSWFELIRNL